MNPKTTAWATIAGVALAFVMFVPDLVGHIPYVGTFLLAVAKFAAAGGLVKFGIEARDR